MVRLVWLFGWLFGWLVGGSWGHFGRVLWPLGGFRAVLKGHFGSLLGSFWEPWGVLWDSLGTLGSFFGVLGFLDPWGRSGPLRFSGSSRPNGPNMAPQMAPRWAKIAQDEPRWRQDGAKMSQDGPRWSQHGAQKALDGAKMTPRCGPSRTRSRHKLEKAENQKTL